MSLRHLRDIDSGAAHELEQQALRLRFSRPLLESLATTMAWSIEAGDGKLWSDSFLLTSLIWDGSSIRTLLDHLPEHRTDLITKKDFRSTLATRNLTIDPTFQTTLHEHLLARARRDASELSEMDLLLIELRCAEEWYRDKYTVLAQFAADLSSSIFDCSFAAKDVSWEQRLRRFAYLLEDSISLALMCQRHPFTIFDASPPAVTLPPDSAARDLPRLQYKTIATYYPRGDFSRARNSFYWLLVDCAGVGIGLGDDEVTRIACLFDYDHFEAICEQMDEMDEDSHTQEAHSSATEVMASQCYFAAKLLLEQNIPIPLLVHRLSMWKAEDRSYAWPSSSKLIVSLGSRAVEVCRSDILSPIPSAFGRDQNDTRQRLANIGLWAPSPVWTDTVLERFEHLINKPDVKEREIQNFFEIYPQFILDELHVEAFPQVVLFQDTAGILKPDFVVRRHESKYVDIVELKLPKALIVHGTPTRPSLSREVSKALAQLKEYREWFRDASNRRQFRQRYGLEGFEPRLTLVIGRRTSLLDEEVRRRAFPTDGLDIITYDDLVAVVKRRRRWLVE